MAFTFKKTLNGVKVRNRKKDVFTYEGSQNG